MAIMAILSCYNIEMYQINMFVDLKCTHCYMPNIFQLTKKKEKEKGPWSASHKRLEQNGGLAQRRPTKGPLPISLAWLCEPRKVKKSHPDPERQEVKRPFSEGHRWNLVTLPTYISTISSQGAASATES